MTPSLYKFTDTMYKIKLHQECAEKIKKEINKNSSNISILKRKR